MWRERILFAVASLLKVNYLLFYQSTQERHDWSRAWTAYRNGNKMQALIMADGMQRRHGYTMAVANLKLVLAQAADERNAQKRKASQASL